METVTDNDLIAASLRGEREAFGQIVERYQTMVCAVGYSATGDRSLSEDVAQDAFIAAWSNLATLKETSKLRSWLAGIARNLGRKALRKRREKLVEPTTTNAVADDNGSPLDATLEAESEALVWNALRRLSDKNREALVLYYCEQRSVREVAAALDVSEDAVMQRLSRGRAQLKKRVEDIVETQLTAARPRRGFAAAVLAALPTLGALPHADAATPSGGAAPPDPTHGGMSMMKIALITAAAALAGGGAYWAVGQAAETNAQTTPTSAASPAALTETNALVRASDREPAMSVKARLGATHEGVAPSLPATLAPQWITSLSLGGEDMSALPGAHDAMRECATRHLGKGGEVVLDLGLEDERVASVSLNSLTIYGAERQDPGLDADGRACFLAVLRDIEGPASLYRAAPHLSFLWRDDTANQPGLDQLDSMASADAQARGPVDAPIQLVVFHDFQCKFCGQVLGTIDQLFDDYPGKIRLVVKQFPIRESSRTAHEAALAAGEQGLFWPMHDGLMANQEELSEKTVMAIAAQIEKLDRKRFEKAMREHTFVDALDADIAEARAMGVRGTPTFLINGRRHTGARPIEYFHKQIAATLDAR